MYYETFRHMSKQLGQLERWFDQAADLAKSKSFEVDTLLTARLAPDQFALVRQIQSTCDVAKLGAARLTGKNAPSHPDTEQTFEALRTRVRSVVEYLGTFTAKDFEGAAERAVTTPRWEGKTMRGADYFLEHALPNFYFHLTHTYAILRHNGVNVGKRDFLGPLTFDAPAG
jgi:uncharacterized protein